jgi:hypothetical protein
MSTDPSANAMGRIDAAVEESSRRSAVPPDELADLATAIQRIESLIVEGAAQEPNGSATVGRIANVAFTLHEREVESSLGDELNAAVREINDLGGLKQLSPERAQQAAELLRQLSRRVHDMIAQSKTDQHSGPAWKKAQFVIADDDDEEHDALDDGAFKTDVPEDDEFALVVAALTAALPSLPEFGAPVPVPPAALARGAAPLADDALLPELSIEAGDEAKTAKSEQASPPAETSGETVVVIESQSSALLDDPVLPPTPSDKEESSREESSPGEPPPAALSDTLLEDLLRDAVQGINPSEGESPAAATEPPLAFEAPAEDSESKVLLDLPPPAEPDAVVAEVVESALPSSEDPSLLPPLTPDDDPGDLFDLTPPAQSNVASMPEPAAPSERAPELAEAIPAPLAASLPDVNPQIPLSPPPPQQSRGAAAPAQPQRVARPAANDPLGPVRALSEEETIALFS